MTKLYKVPADFAARTRITHEQYRTLYDESVRDPEGFWSRMGQRVDWVRPYTRVKDVSFDARDFHIRWFEDGQLNVSANCLDRHLATRGDKTAIIWEGDDPDQSERVTYRELYHRVCRLANALRSLGVQKGDRVTIYLPMIPEAAVAMLACARIGAIHSVVFGGFSPDSLAGRIADCASTVVITVGRGRAWRQAHRAQGERRPGAECARHRDGAARARHPPHGIAGADVPPRQVVPGAGGRPARRVRAGGRGRGRPALHPLHVRLDRQAEGRAAHERRLPRVRVAHPRGRVRPARRRHLLVHGRRRLGHRPQLRRVRPARERRDVA